MARTNGGIIGVVNKSSFGKNTVSSQTSDGNICTQAGTTLIDATVVAGGAAGGVNGNSGGGGGAGGFRNFSSILISAGAAVPAVVGGGGAAIPAPGCQTGNGNNGSLSKITVACVAYQSAGGGGGGGQEASAP